MGVGRREDDGGEMGWMMKGVVGERRRRRRARQ